ncbi:unnamed protein product [Linum tenue]|uniref:Uncharacterized protein n=1 Tax=Linum tenue TaxID=586396 RepID=A0AAV0HEA8_9ROSI|nr:unnamed protein product [Linum tenue]
MTTSASTCSGNTIGSSGISDQITLITHSSFAPWIGEKGEFIGLIFTFSIEITTDANIVIGSSKREARVYL